MGQGMKLRGALYLTTAASIWGGMYVVSKYVLAYIPPFTLLWMRYVVAFVLLYIILQSIQLRQEIKIVLTSSDWQWFALIGFVGYFISVALQFMGTKLSDAHTGALITAASPAFILLFAWGILKESITKRKVSALLLATTGVLIVIGLPRSWDESFLGNLYLFGAAITWALLSVFVKKVSSSHHSLTITTYALLFAILYITPAMLWEWRVTQFNFYEQLFATPWVTIGILYLGIVATAIAFFLWNRGMALMEAGVGSLFFFFQPLVGALLGWWVLNEKLTINFWIGALFILLGVSVAVWREGRGHTEKGTSYACEVEKVDSL